MLSVELQRICCPLGILQRFGPKVGRRIQIVVCIAQSLRIIGVIARKIICLAPGIFGKNRLILSKPGMHIEYIQRVVFDFRTHRGEHAPLHLFSPLSDIKKRRFEIFSYSRYRRYRRLVWISVLWGQPMFGILIINP